MSNSEGWIKLHRKFSEWEWFNNSEMVHLFIYLLLNANNENGTWKGISVKRGQIITGLQALCKSTGISIQTLRTCLANMKSTGEITSESTNKYSIITICEYDSYQEVKKQRQQAKQQAKQHETNSKQEVLDKSNTEEEERNWKTSYDIYFNECKKAFGDIARNDTFIKKQEYFFPNVNILKTMELSFSGYWKTKKAWEHKKAQKYETIDWEATIRNVIKSPKDQIKYSPNEQRDINLQRERALAKYEKENSLN